jgi:hypothetical protein
VYITIKPLISSRSTNSRTNNAHRQQQQQQRQQSHNIEDTLYKIGGKLPQNVCASRVQAAIRRAFALNPGMMAAAICSSLSPHLSLSQR